MKIILRKNIMKIFATLVGFLMLVSACSPQLTPFSKQLYNKNNWSDYELAKIQFYLSDDIVLERVSEKNSETNFQNGEIHIDSGKKLEKIVIPAGTPGILLFKPNEDNFAISFDNANDNKFLVFGPNPKNNGNYGLLASEWKNKSGIVTYNGQKYRTPLNSAFAKLLVNLKQTNRVVQETNVVKGRKTGQ